MRLISKRREHVRSLSPDECDLVKRYSAQEVSGLEVDRANRLLRQARMDNHWVECDCVNPAPVMHVRLEDNGKLVLSNNPSTHEHAIGCACGKAAGAKGLRSPSSKPETARFDRNDQIALHVEFSGITPLQETQNSSRSAKAITAPTGPKKPVLSLLLTLCDDAGLNVYNPARPVSLSAQFQNIRDAADRFTLAQGIPLSSAMDTRIDMRRMIQLGKRLKAMGHRRGRITGLLFDRVKGFEARTLTLTDGKAMGFFGHVEKTSALPAPLLAMATVTTQTPGGTFFELGHVAMMPSVSGSNLFPVGSAFERELVLALMGLCDWMLKKNVCVSIHRHLLTDDSYPALVLRSRDRLLELRIGEPSVLTEDEQSEAADSQQRIEDTQVLWVTETDDLALIKRRIAGYFMEIASKENAE